MGKVRSHQRPSPPGTAEAKTDGEGREVHTSHPILHSVSRLIWNEMHGRESSRRMYREVSSRAVFVKPLAVYHCYYAHRVICHLGY